MKTKSIVTIVASLAIGYLAGSLFGIPVSNGNGKGSISKVSKHNKVTLSPTLSAYQEKLMNDSLEMKKATIQLQLITSRIAEFSSLVNLAVRAGSGILELEEPIINLKSLQQLSANVINASTQAINSFGELKAGQINDQSANYEQALKNLTLSYLLVGRQTEVGKQFVLAVDEYMIGRDAKDFGLLSMTRDMWASYCYGAATLEKDFDEQSFWTGKANLLDKDDMNAFFTKYGNKTLLYGISIDGKLGLIADNMKGLEALGKNVEAYDNNVEAFGKNVEAYDNDVEAFGKNVEAYDNDVEAFGALLEALGWNNDAMQSDMESFNNDFEAYGIDFESLAYDLESHGVNVEAGSGAARAY